MSTIAVDVALRMFHPIVGTAVWSGSAIDCSYGATAATLPGITSGQTAANHGGLMIGGRMRSIQSASGVPERLFGIGQAHIAKLLPFQARRFADYSAARIDAALVAYAADTAGDGWWLA